MPVLWAYARDLFQTPGFGDTTDFVQIKQHYYIVHTDINPSGIVPKGPDLANWLTPHGREALGGKPFGDGTPPGPPRDGREGARRSRRLGNSDPFGDQLGVRNALHSPFGSTTPSSTARRFRSAARVGIDGGNGDRESTAGPVERVAERRNPRIPEQPPGCPADDVGTES